MNVNDVGDWRSPQCSHSPLASETRNSKTVSGAAASGMFSVSARSLTSTFALTNR